LCLEIADKILATKGKTQETRNWLANIHRKTHVKEFCSNGDK